MYRKLVSVRNWQGQRTVSQQLVSEGITTSQLPMSGYPENRRERPTYHGGELRRRQGSIESAPDAVGAELVGQARPRDTKFEWSSKTH